MKNITYIFIIAFIFVSCENKPTETESLIHDDSFLADSVITLYKNDSYRLALRYMIKNDSDYLDKTEISEDIYLQFYEGIVLILKSDYINQVDSIKKILSIHTWDNPLFSDIIVGISDTSIFDLIENHEKTGIKDYDSLLSFYNFSLKRSLIFGDQGYFTYQTDQIINLYAFCNMVKKIPIVNSADLNRTTEGPSDIIGNILDDRLEYKFRYKWGDCWSGCIWSRTWEFNVLNNNDVVFIDSYGDKIP